MTARTVHPQKAPDVRRWTGISAIAVAVTMLFEAFTQMIDGGRPGLWDCGGLSAFFQQHATDMLIIIATDTVLMSGLIVFFACFRQLVRVERPELTWIADLHFGAGLVFVAVTLVGDAMGGGAALEAQGADPDPSVIRALTEGHILMFGTVGVMLTAVVCASAGYLTFATRVLPRWIGWVAYAAALGNVAVIPTLFGGTDETSLFSVGGWANAVLGTFPFLLWVIFVGMWTIRGERRHLLRLARHASAQLAREATEGLARTRRLAGLDEDGVAAAGATAAPGAGAADPTAESPTAPAADRGVTPSA